MACTEQSSPTIPQQYASWPYPNVPLLAAVPSTHPWQLHCDYLWDRCGSGPAPLRPRLWIAGCGTMQPYVLAVANPRASIVASDISEPSLRLAERRCRLHGKRNVDFRACDLQDKATWPEGEFDLIECYGVLMNLRDPQATLRELGRRLSPRGVLRVMVYPHFSRARIFQLQQVARLCGLHAGDRSHPRRFAAICKALPGDHPLRYAFASYADSKNAAGIVDAFLHRGDRGFTGHQLGAAIEAAGLEPAFWFHRPWAQPAVMAERLGLQSHAASTVLGYLDLWQELRQNFVVCLRRADAPPRERGPERGHPLFARSDAGLRHALRLLRLRWLGGAVPSKTAAGDVVLRAADARALAADIAALSPSRRAELQDHGLWLGGDLPPLHEPAHRELAGEAAFLAAASTLRCGRRAPNPLYAHLFAAWEQDRLQPELSLPDLETRAGRWLPWAEPLERGRIAFGLSPYGTLQRFRQSIHDHLQRTDLGTAADWNGVRLRQDGDCLLAARRFAIEHGAARRDWSDADLRELWCLLFSYRDLFLTLLSA